MKIESSSVNMQSSSSFVQEEHSLSRLQVFSNLASKKLPERNHTINMDNFEKLKAIYNSEDNLSLEDKMKKRIIELLLQQILQGKKQVKLHPQNELLKLKESTNPYNESLKTQNWGFTFESTQEYYQKSSIEFSTQASIKTNNGEFNIDINLSFTQEFYERHSTKISAGAAFQDPLIMNYNSDIGTFNSISKNMSFEFDLNGDGKNETIPELINGSGFLALDKNKNGTIDDGSELFGPTTGDGFEELRAYDEDGNNWIDENDSIYSDLLVWEKDSQGNQSLITLGQAGIGAIYLAGINTDFNYTSGYNNIQANMKEASFFLKENGEAGMITSVDFAV